VAATRIIEECRQLNADSKFEFIQADVSLLENVDRVCRQIKDQAAALTTISYDTTITTSTDVL